MQTLTYGNVSLDKWAAIKNLVETHGLTVVGDVGWIDKLGCRLSYIYCPKTLHLAITVVSPPIFHSMSSFLSLLNDTIEKVTA